MIVEPRKDFEKPESGEFNGTIVDVIDLGKVTSKFDGSVKTKLRVVWVLGTPDGSGKYAMDSEGNPFRVMREVNATIDEKSKLTEIVKGVLGTAVPVPFDSEILMGRSNKLFIEKGPDAKTGKVYSNVKYITALAYGHIPPPIPQGFVRAKDRPPKTPFGQPQAAANTTATAPTAQPTVQGAVQANPGTPPTPAPQPAAQPVVPKVDAAF
jgi:hypothetical protein